MARRLGIERLGFAAVGVLGFGAMLLSSVPAEAANVVAGIGFPGYGFTSPPPYYPYAYPAYYGYTPGNGNPLYGGDLVFGFGGGHHWQ